jgi:hypothetical protein
MLLRSLGAFVFALAFSSVAFAHGGGGGGGHGGGHVVIVGGCCYSPDISPPPDPQIGDTSHITSVAILSSVGQSLQLRTPGGDWFATKKTVDISMWGLDDFVADNIGRHLSERFTVKAMTYDRKALAAIPTGDGQSSATVLNHYLAALSNPGVDAFVIIRPDDAGAYQHTPGLSLIASTYPAEWLGYEIEILDAHTFRRISWGFARMQYRAGAPASFAGYVAQRDRSLDETLTPTPKQFELLQGDFRHHLVVTIAHTLRAMQLGLRIPAPGDEPLAAIPPELKRYPQIRNVAVVSAIGDTFTFGYRTVLFVHHTTQAPATDTTLDGNVESMIAAALDKRFVVKNVPVDRASLGKLQVAVPSPFLPIGVLPSPIAGLSPRDDIDAYIVVLKRASPEGPLQDPMPGVGIFKHKPFGDESTGIFANYEIAVIDAHTLKPLGHAAGVASPHWPSPALYRAVDNGIWPAGDVDALAPGADATVKSIVHDLLADSIGETLLGMGLTGMTRDLEDSTDSTPTLSGFEPPEPIAGMQQ